MCVPVKFKFSRRKSTSSVRGSTSASRGSPFTRIRTAIFSTPDIFVSRLHAFASRTAYRDAQRALHPRRHERALIVRGTAHVTLRFRCFPRCLGRALNRLFVYSVASQLRLSFLCPNRGQADATQNNANVFASVLAIERELHSGTRCGVDGRATLESQVGATGVLRRLLYDDFSHQLFPL